LKHAYQLVALLLFFVTVLVMDSDQAQFTLGSCGKKSTQPSYKPNELLVRFRAEAAATLFRHTMSDLRRNWWGTIIV
jgi:hypothetical protein